MSEFIPDGILRNRALEARLAQARLAQAQAEFDAMGRQAAANLAMRINVRYEVRPDGGLVPVEAPGMESFRRLMAEALNSECEAIMLGALQGDGNAVTRATERGIEPVQPRDLWVDPENIMSLENSSHPPQELSGLAPDFGRARSLAWYGAMAFNSVVNSPDRCVFVSGGEVRDCDVQSIKFYFGQPTREQRFDDLRAEGKKLGEINAILEAEGYSEVSGEGVMPCPTKSHEIVRENKGAKRMIEGMP